MRIPRLFATALALAVCAAAGQALAGAHNLTPSSGVTYGTAAPKFGTANLQDTTSGTSYLTLGSGVSVGIASPTAWAMEAWIKASASQSVFQAAVTLDANDNMGISGNNTYAAATVGGVGIYSAKVVADGTWHHEAVSCGVLTCNLFVDGVIVGSASAPTSLPIPNVIIGALATSGASGHPFVGFIDEVAFWGFNKYSAAFTPQSAAYAGAERMSALYHLDSLGVDSATLPASSTYYLSPPSPASSLVGSASGPFTIETDGTNATGFSVSPTDEVGCVSCFSPTSVSIAASSGVASSATFTYTPTTPGAHTISASNTGSLLDAPGVNFNANANGIQYSSDNPNNGFDVTTLNTSVLGWTSVTGNWIACSTSATTGSCALIPSHIHGFGDGAQGGADVVVLSGVSTFADTDVTVTQVAFVNANDSNFSLVDVGINANVSASQGYLLAFQQGSDGSTSVNAILYRRASGSTVSVATSSSPVFTLPSTTSGARVVVHMRIYKVGSVVSGNVWLDGAAEPATPSVTYTDGSVLAAGQPWLYNAETLSGVVAAVTDLSVNNVPYGEANSISLTSPAPLQAGATIPGRYTGTAPTGFNLALDGATTFAAATSSIGSGMFTITLPTSTNAAYHQLTVQAANLPTEQAATPAFDVVGLTIGALSATPGASGITVGLSAPLSLGTGTGYSYAIYRGTDPNFTANAGSLLATTTSMPYLDTTAVQLVQYFYGVVGSDSSGKTVNAFPTGVTLLGSPTVSQPLYASAALTVTDLNVSFLGDSRTFCAYCSVAAVQGTLKLSAGSATPPYWAAQTLKAAFGLRTVNAFNAGCNGSWTTYWLKGAAGYCSNAYGYDLYAYGAGTSSLTGMAALVAADPTAAQVFAIMLDANDANHGLTPTTFISNLTTIITSLLTDWPAAKVVVNEGSYFTPTIYAGGAATLSVVASYRPLVPGMIASLATTFPGRVFLGDTSSWNYFALHYATEMAPQAALGPGLGTGYLHQNDVGSVSLGDHWGSAIAAALFAPATGPQFKRTFH